MAFIIWQDDTGKEIMREKKGKGRPPRGSTKEADGNFHVQKSDKDMTIYYIIQDDRGEIIEKIRKGRGRPKPDFVKAPDGNWYKTSPVVVE